MNNVINFNAYKQAKALVAQTVKDMGLIVTPREYKDALHRAYNALILVEEAQ